MTTLREAAQQALEALEETQRHRAYTQGIPDAITSLRAALAQPDTCEWTQDGDEESATWHAACSGRYFMLEDGTPTDNRMTNCCYCGKKLVEVPFEQEEDDV